MRVSGPAPVRALMVILFTSSFFSGSSSVGVVATVALEETRVVSETTPGGLEEGSVKVAAGDSQLQLRKKTAGTDHVAVPTSSPFTQQ